MPIYEYMCDDGHVTNKLCVRKSEITNETECTVCGNNAKKIMSAPNHKIEGYSYKNGYGLKGKKNGTDKPVDS